MVANNENGTKKQQQQRNKPTTLHNSIGKRYLYHAFRQQTNLRNLHEITIVHYQSNQWIMLNTAYLVVLANRHILYNLLNSTQTSFRLIIFCIFLALITFFRIQFFSLYFFFFNFFHSLDLFGYTRLYTVEIAVRFVNNKQSIKFCNRLMNDIHSFAVHPIVPVQSAAATTTFWCISLALTSSHNHYVAFYFWFSNYTNQQILNQNKLFPLSLCAWSLTADYLQFEWLFRL